MKDRMKVEICLTKIPEELKEEEEAILLNKMDIQLCP